MATRFGLTINRQTHSTCRTRCEAEAGPIFQRTGLILYEPWKKFCFRETKKCDFLQLFISPQRT
jgi:hypothetical protein